MFRRIEVIHDGLFPEKTGLETMVGPFPPEIDYHDLRNAWSRLGSIGKVTYKNCRFYFTDRGWKEVGRHMAADLQKIKQRYRVIAVKERSVDVIYRDALQVAVRPRKKLGTVKITST